MSTTVLTAIGQIYDTALASARWSPTLDHIADCTGANGGMLIVRDPDRPDLEITTMSSRYHSDDAKAWMGKLQHGEELRWAEQLAQVPALTVLTDEQVWPDRTTYNAIPTVQFLNDLNLHNRCAARLSEHSGWWDSIALLYKDNRKGIQSDELVNLQRLLPHLARAIATQRPLVMLERRFRAVLSVLDRLGIGVLFLQPDRSVALANKEAERILASRDGLQRSPDGRLAGNGDTQAQLSRALQQVSGPGNSATITSLAIARPSGGESYALDLRPLRDGDAFGEAFDGALALLIDPDHRAMISTEGLARSFGLTTAETAVCSLIADGLTANEIAEARNVSVGTIKTQTHAIFDKTRTRNRSELIRRALSIVPPLLDEQGRRTT